MASTREERLQMRQRGAGTRKIQQVDFGFSFGDQLGGLGDPAPPSLFPEPAKPPQEPPAPIATTPRASQSTSQSASQSQRTPGSARNNVPQRASAYDIPSDDAPQEPRSSKRRRINPINESSGSPSPRKDRQSGHDNAKPANGDALSAKESQTNDTTLPDAPPQEPTVEAPEPPAVPEVPGDIEMQEAGNGEPDDQNTRAEATQQPSATQPEGQDGTQKEKPVEKPQEPQPSDVQPQETQHSVESTKPAPKKQRKSRSPPQTEDHPSTRTEKDPAAAKEIEAPAQLSKEKKKTQRARERSLNGDSSPGQAAEKPRKEDGTRSKPRDSQASGARGKRSGSRPLSSGKNTDEAQARLEPEPEQPQPEPEADEALNPRRGRPAKKDKKPAEAESNTTAERPEADVDAQLEKETGPSKPSRGRPARKDKTPAEPESTTRPEESEAVDVQLEKDAGRSKSRGRSAKKDKQSAASESNTRTDQQEEEPAPSKASRGRPARKDKTSDNAEESEPQPDPQPEPAAESSKSHRAKDGKKKKRTREPEPEAAPPEEQPVPESAQQPGPEQPDEEEQEPEDSRPSQQGTTKRGRKSKKTAAETTPTEEPAESEPARERRKPREPRGETVPVTVHRLANSSALGMMYASGGSDEENEDSADELSTRQKTKLPKRGGVNPADVLGQICRETLEKTLTALKNGIENESNTQRRAEWTRKRKAVEAFGSELDGRLLDLSEMLDSNFVLGVQLKKEKRDMIDLRTHLYKVRKEREAIALQMDAVRAKHMEEEAAKTSRTTINNSLHSLELALDRTQHRDPPSADPSSAELEFLLRTVADDVSCRAPGSQGGLLEQIRTFNAQLESTARRLEGQ